MEQPPDNTDGRLKEYLVRQLSKLQALVENSSALPVLSALPVKPLVGKIYYFDRIIPATAITSVGVWVYKPTGWVLLG
jgi:hypothetical protein